MNIFNGFDNEKHLTLARAMLEEARTFERAQLSLQGLDAFCLQCAQAKIEGYGVIFPLGDFAGLEAGLMGPLGRHLLKIAHSAKPRSGPAEPLPPHLFLATPSATTTMEPALHTAQAQAQAQAPVPVLNAQHDLAGPIDDDFDEDFFDEMKMDEPHDPIALIPPPPPARIELDNPSLTLDQVKALLVKGSDLKRKIDPLETALTQSFNNQCVFTKRMSWDAWGGSAKSGARQFAQSKGLILRMSEFASANPEQRAHEMGLIAIDPGALPAAPGEPIEAADFERQIDEAFRSQLTDAFTSMEGMAKSAVVICGWGSRGSRMIDIAKNMEFETIDLDPPTSR